MLLTKWDIKYLDDILSNLNDYHDIQKMNDAQTLEDMQDVINYILKDVKIDNMPVDQYANYNNVVFDLALLYI